MDITFTTFVPIIIALIASVPGIYALWRNRGKDKADAAKVLVDSASTIVSTLLRPLETRIDEMELALTVQEKVVVSQGKEIDRQRKTINRQAERIRKLEHDRDVLLEGVEMLCEQLRALGQEPVWEPTLDEEGVIE